MKPDVQGNEATAIAWTPQVVLPNEALESSSAERPESRLAEGSEIVGTVFFQGPVVIQGKLEGEIEGQDKITIGEKGSLVTNTLRGDSIVIGGTATVETIASRRIEILPTGKVYGNLASTLLVIHEGAQFEGSASAREVGRKLDGSGTRSGESRE